MTVRDKIRAAIADKQLSMSDLSRNVLGRNHAYLQQYLERGTPAKLPEDVRAALAPALGMEESELREPGAQKLTTYRGNVSTVPQKSHDQDKIKVLGMAECGPDGWAMWNGEVVDMVPRPPMLSGAVNGFAVYAIGVSMEPRYHPGEVIYIHPGRPVTPGSYVLVQMHPKDGDAPRAFLKRLVKRTGDKVILEQFEPKKTFRLDASEILSMYKVVGSGEA